MELIQVYYIIIEIYTKFKSSKKEKEFGIAIHLKNLRD